MVLPFTIIQLVYLVCMGVGVGVDWFSYLNWKIKNKLQISADQQQIKIFFFFWTLIFMIQKKKQTNWNWMVKMGWKMEQLKHLSLNGVHTEKKCIISN